ncbi:MAG: hypothetical protein A2Y37_05145 [Spirochaetes bacterium GWB1_60_80]|nr:MAG: hypothetical protein A2Y37_05145 [Spirochaetes bacterium GWB1_60_80]OHD60245.1 MAG: hypothetical protein A2Y32_07385 [Spirochaetes bacterium GWF1_60_12]HAX37601.1 hypothetical protein [Spirochaetaceae bacterium]HBO40979.1 hypothetical protein [Spirochaetaceae bacterium]
MNGRQIGPGNAQVLQAGRDSQAAAQGDNRLQERGPLPSRSSPAGSATTQADSTSVLPAICWRMAASTYGSMTALEKARPAVELAQSIGRLLILYFPGVR